MGSLSIKTKGLFVSVFIFLMMLFPVSLLEVFNKYEPLKLAVFASRMLVLLLTLVTFLLKYKTVKLPRISIIFFVFVFVVIFTRGVTKFAIDITILLNLAILYYNMDNDDQEYVNLTMAKYFIYFPIVAAFLVLIGVLENSYYDDGTMLNKLGFNNPNYFSFLLLFGLFIAYLNHYKRLMIIAIVAIIVGYLFAETLSVVLISFALIASTIVFSKRTTINKVLLILLLFVVFLLLNILVFYQTLLLPENWQEIATWRFQSNLMSRIHNNAFKLLEIKEHGFWFGGLSSKEDNFFVNYWAAFGIIGVLYFIYLSFRAAAVKYKFSYRISFFVISIILLGQIEQTLYSTSFVSILYFYFLLTVSNKQYVFRLMK